jgi:hypothetical protein
MVDSLVATESKCCYERHWLLWKITVCYETSMAAMKPLAAKENKLELL